MPSVMLRHRGPSDGLMQALQALGETFERSWSPGDPGRFRSGPRMEDYGFSLCLLDEEEISRAEAITEGIEQLEEIAAGLAATGLSLRGCTMDIGFFPSPDTAMMSTTVSASQCAKLAALGVDFEFTFYPSQHPPS